MFNINQGATVGNSQVRFEPNGFIAVQTGTYQAQCLRPFKSNTNEAVVGALRQATHDGLNLGVAAVQEIASDVIVPQAMVEGEVMIPHNFTSARFRLMCRVNESHPFIQGTTTQRVFFGYSDHCDVAMGGKHLPDDMRIYFNSETIIQESIVPTPHGPQTQARIIGSNQIISPVNMMGGNNGMFARPSNFLIRPEDNFNLMQTKAVAKNLQENGLVDVKIDTSYDYRTMVGEGGSFKYSMRKDTSPVRYLSSSLGAYQHARSEYNDTMRDSDTLLFNKGSDPTETLLGEAANMCRNHAIQSNTFLGILREHAGFMERGYVTWKRLKELFPELCHPEVAKFAMNDGTTQRKVVSQAHQSQTFNGADNKSIAVALLSQAIPSIMMDTFFRQVSFAVTNGSGPNEYLFEIFPNGTQSIIRNFDMRPYIQQLERRVKVDILNNISRGNQIPFRISCSSDLAGETIMDISLGNDPVERYVAPTFADSLFSPVITRNQELSNEIANDITWLVRKVIDGDASRQPEIDMTQVYTPYQHPVAPAAQFNPQALNTGAQNNVANLGLL
ncbi:hypothetical protein ST201phi2-1p125 [Pseudomonas phage 201phi2-1]|uniref:Uncharacterized protein n=1 Tax=Pseudomonas phage 201phi2-1 TaxID=198110 RepID=B3FIY8_BP201|nr:hypothetical protein ST201phi2-1p125 [Pseudomonas phage 201phi2-1]ABY62957.1 hypothetical protein 201phi2-1p125 [Pseudomonas phage 201phi2-1]